MPCRLDWEVNGPMVAGLVPLQSIERLKKFEHLFEVSWTIFEHLRANGRLFTSSA